MAQNSYSQWQYLDPLGAQTGGTTGSAAKTYPIVGHGPEPWFRDRADALRSARIPTAEYPDGYLGTTRTRREDRLVTGGARLTQKSYQRGIHVGARVDPQSYLWDENVDMLAGIRAQAEGRKWSITGAAAPQTSHPAGVSQAATHLTNDGKPMPRGSQSLQHHVGESRFDDVRLRPRYR